MTKHLVTINQTGVEPLIITFNGAGFARAAVDAINADSDTTTTAEYLAPVQTQNWAFVHNCRDDVTTKALSAAAKASFEFSFGFRALHVQDLEPLGEGTWTARVLYSNEPVVRQSADQPLALSRRA